MKKETARKGGLRFFWGFKFGLIEEIQDTKIQRYKIKNGRRKGFRISCISYLVSLYLT